jgi:ABC-type transporter Mla subunit MlaD
MTGASPRTKRLLAGGGLLLVVAIVVALGLGASGGGDGGSYRVRAIFDTASFLVPGEDVKIAGVKVGSIESLDVTRDNKAAIVLRIDDPAFKDFKQDAFCTIRLQSLIGEKFVACEPTQPRDANAQVPPRLRKITHGDGKGQYLLPLANTSSPVDVDLLSDIMRVPERQRFAIIINELGAGLAGNGKELQAVLRRADPTLREFDNVLAVLASQRRTLARLADESDVVLRPLAANSESISRFVASAGATAAATAERGDALEASFARLPAFLQQLTPTARRLGEFAAAGTPVMIDLRAAAPSVNRLFEQLGPFSTAALPTFRTLGNLSDVGRRALPRSEPTIRDIASFAKTAKPLSSRLARALTNLKGQFGIQRLLQVILYTVGGGNLFDEFGHLLRTYLYTPSCLDYKTTQDFGCKATFGDYSGNKRPPTSPPRSSAHAASTPPAPVASAAPTAATQAAAAVPSDAGTATNGGAEAGLLGYLLGNGSGR